MMSKSEMTLSLCGHCVLELGIWKACDVECAVGVLERTSLSLSMYLKIAQNYRHCSISYLVDSQDLIEFLLLLHIYFLINKLVPLISLGCSTPMASRMVGATSPNTPSCFFKLHPSGAFAMMNGTLFVVCDVFGLPSSLSISSALLQRYQHILHVTNLTLLTRDLLSGRKRSHASCKPRRQHRWRCRSPCSPQ